MTLYVKDSKLAYLKKRGEKLYFMLKIIIFIVLHLHESNEKNTIAPFFFFRYACAMVLVGLWKTDQHSVL